MRPVVRREFVGINKMNVYHIRLSCVLFAIVCSVSPYTVTAAPTTLHWVGCGITKKAFMSQLASAFQAKTGIHIIIQGGGATKGIRDVSEGLADMGGSCRQTLPLVVPQEDDVSLVPVAWDALAVIVNAHNPLANITSDQLRALYDGKITNWNQLGGSNTPIHLYVRAGKISGVGYAIRQYLFQDSQHRFMTAPAYIEPSTGPLEQAVEHDPLGVAITGISSARKRNVNIVAIDGLKPTYDNIADGRYEYYRPLYLVTPPSPSAEVREFVDFALSNEGRAILRKQGTVPYFDALGLMSKSLVYGFGVK